MKLHTLKSLEAYYKRNLDFNSLNTIEDKDRILNTNPDPFYTKDAYVYVYFDPRGSIQRYEIVEGIWTTRACVYVGKGCGPRVFHKQQPNNAKDENLQKWIKELRSNNIEPIVGIWCANLDKEQSEWVEADVMRIFREIQDPSTGHEVYRSFRTPPTLFNLRRETSKEFRIYNEEGKPYKHLS